MKSISIVFPVYNEKENLEKLISSWDESLRLQNVDHEFVIVEDGSTDGTKKLILELEKKYPIINLSQNQKRGYTTAVIDGIYSSSKKFILCTDSDNQIKVKSLIENLNNFPEIDEFLVGFRNPRKDPLNRLIYSKIFKILHDLLFNSKLKDPSCPFVIGLKVTYKKLDKKKLLYMKEGFWWGFTAICIKYKISLFQKKIIHRKRSYGKSDIYKVHKLPDIVIRNILGLLKIRFLR